QQQAGADILRGIVAEADILVENYRTGVMDRLGLGYETLAAINPRLIYCAISGFGLEGPLRDKPSFDIVTQALSGALSINGERGHMPVKLGIPLGDMVGGIFGPMAILAALHERSQTGCGRLIDISLYDGLIGMLGYFAQLAAADVPHAPVLGVTAALAHPHAVAREMVVEAEHPTIGPMRVIGRPIKFPDAPQRPVTAPPSFGQHTAAVLRDELGYGAAEI